MAEESFFNESFHALTGNDPFPWQGDLYRDLAEGHRLRPCTIPTGLGKTAIIPIWLIALAANPANVPRRLVYVVNRRTVVDQATDEAKSIRERLATYGTKTIQERLRKLCADPDEIPLAISTLRGQFADNREWSADPSRPAIILGTVDMIGSRLLFSGYGIGFKSKPLHAGFLGQDVLLVHDEAHLEPAFQQLLIAIEKEQDRCKGFRRFQVMELTATTRGSDNVSEPSDGSQGDEPFGLTEKDLAVPEIKKRFEARKTVHFHPIDDEKKLPEKLADLAIQHKDSNRAVLVFARTVEAVEKVAEKVRKALGNSNERVETLTGTIRGKERDDLVNKPVFRRFLPNTDPGEKSVYLICTSAGEVGVNISADDLTCDLSTFESMAQRFGRVNRFGTRDDTRIDVVHSREFDLKDKYESQLKKTLGLLGKLNGDGSPAALDKLDPAERRAAFSPEPTILPVSDILFDAWALTTVRGKMPGRPMVEPYLHGISAQDPPETHLAWREEVECITDPLSKRYKPEDLLEDYPIKPHELLRDRSNRVFERLASLARKHPNKLVWLLDDDGSVEILTLDQIADKDRKDRINFRTVVLPLEVGGLKNGLLTGNPEDKVDDITDEWLDEADQPRRRRVWDDDEPPDQMRLIRTIDTKPDAGVEEENEAEGSSKRFWYWYVRPRSADDDGSRTSRGAVKWCVHTNDVTEKAEKIVEALPLPEDEKKAVSLAAKYHDLGKKRIVWQRGIGNPIPTDWLAKSGRHYRFGKMKPIELTTYRHEFGSLLDALDQPEFAELNDDQKDLVLHLIAVHHGFGRPHFPSDIAFDPEPRGNDVGSITAEVPRRFARLQRKYGRWRLAYLESLLRAADYAASAKPSSTLEDHA